MRGPTSLLLLPGMDGTGRLFAPLVGELPPAIAPRVVAYPPDEALDYDQLLPRVRRELPRGGEFVILGESFSGPLALRLAAERPPGLRAVILAASFVTSPLPWAPAWAVKLAAPLAFGAAGMRLAALALGVHECGPAVAQEFRAACSTVARAVLARRARAIVDVDLRGLDLAGVPALVLTAGRDRLLGPGQVAAITRLLPHARVVQLDTPHLLLQAAPAAAAAAIARFIAEL